MFKVLVCEDSAPVSQLLVELINRDPALQVIGVAGNGREAVALTHKLRPDIITMDVRMPMQNGFEAARQIMAECPTPIVMVSELAETDVALSMSALSAGALTAIAKPHGPGHPDFRNDAERLCYTIKIMAEVKVVRHWQSQKPVAKTGFTPLVSDIGATPIVAPKLIAIGSSTGGPSALASLLGSLPASFNLPILITQHIMPGFDEGLARWLSTTTNRRVIVAQDGLSLEFNTGQTILAPDTCHLTLLANARVRLDRRGPVNGVIPSVDLMFNSVATTFGAAAVGVILTGMGRDGAAGLQQMRQSGSYTIAQDEASCVVFGMPKEAIALGAVSSVLPLDKIAGQLVKLGTIL